MRNFPIRYIEAVSKTLEFFYYKTFLPLIYPGTKFSHMKIGSGKKMFANVKKYFYEIELAEAIAPEHWASALIKLACILVIGLVLLQGIFIASNITADSAVYGAYNAVVGNVKSGYTLASLMVLVVGAVAILNFLGFV